MEMKPEITNIDLKCWRNHNPYYGEALLNASMKRAKTKLEKFDRSYDFETCREVTEEIESKIGLYSKNPTDELAVDVVDLVSLWGGGEGVKLTRKSFYGSARKDLSQWVSKYREFIDRVSKLDPSYDDPKDALALFEHIRGIGMSFATKHLKWWGRYPIYDNRIGLLLYSRKNVSTINKWSLRIYSNYLLDIRQLGIKNDLNLLEVEKALFAFSQNYFPNSKLELLNEPECNYQRNIAESIASRWCS